MKTLFLFQEEFMTPKFFELDGDYSHLHKTYINSGISETYPEISADEHDRRIAEYERKTDELTALIYEPESGRHKDSIKFLDSPTKDWDYYVECGFIP